MLRQLNGNFALTEALQVCQKRPHSNVGVPLDASEAEDDVDDVAAWCNAILQRNRDPEMRRRRVLLAAWAQQRQRRLQAPAAPARCAALQLLRHLPRAALAEVLLQATAPLHLRGVGAGGAPWRRSWR